VNPPDWNFFATLLACTAAGWLLGCVVGETVRRIRERGDR
jgi:hypothetical protein